MMFVTPASPAMIVAIAPAFPITAFIRFTLIPAAMIAVVMAPPAIFTPFIMVVPVIPVAPATTVLVVTVIIAIANL